MVGSTRENGRGGAESQTAFVYSAEPQAVPSKRMQKPKYREQYGDEDSVSDGNNIMFDRRVIRGNTFAAQVVTQSAAREAERLRAEHEQALRKEALRRRKEAELSMMPRTPPAVNGRVHLQVQTDDFLEELMDRPLEAEMETQTDAFLDRPPSPMFIPTKTGVDANTQVEVGELFDFDLEVEPILEVLVGKTVELSVLEVCEEEELAAIRSRQELFNQQRNAELAEVQRVEAEAKRKFAEKQRRLRQQQEARKAREALLEKVAARSFAHNYLASLATDVFDDMEEDGTFFDPLQREIGQVFLPWLMGKVGDAVSQVAECRRGVDSLVGGAVVLSSLKCEEAKADRAEFKERERQAKKEALIAAAAKLEAETREEGEEEEEADTA